VISRLKEDKRFAAVLAGLVVAVLVWNTAVRGKAASRIVSQAKSLDSDKGRWDALNQRGAVSQEQLRRATEASQELNEKLRLLVERIRYDRDPRFVVPKDVTAKEHFQNQRMKSEEMIKKGRSKGITFVGRTQQLLNLTQAPTTDDEAHESLIRLDLLYRFLGALYDASKGTTTIDDIQPYLGVTEHAPTAQVADRFLNTVKVGVKFQCAGETLFRVVHALGNPDKNRRGALKIEEFVAERPDPTVDKVKVSLVLAAILIDSSKPLSEGAPQ
jgi:hypothetical protein